jgi:hypothetical protein
MSHDIENALKNVKKADVPNSTFSKVDDVLQTLKTRKENVIMKPKFKKSFAAALIAAMFLLSATVFAATNYDTIIGVIFKTPPHETIGVYTPDGNSSVMLALQENNHFALRGSEYLSVTPTGIYRVEGDKLILTVEDDEIIFAMGKDRLIFESGATAN